MKGHVILNGLRALCVPVAAFCLAGIGHAATVTDIARARASITEPHAAGLAAGMQRLRDRGAALELVNTLRERILTGSLDEIAREALLERGLHLLAELPPHPASRALAGELASRAPRVFIRGDPDHGARAIPLYDVGAVARFALRAWLRSEARDQAMTAIRMRRSDPLEQFGASADPADHDPRKAGVLEAFDRAASTDLLAYRAALVSSATGASPVDELLLLFARRLRDPELFALFFERCESAIAVRALQEIPLLLDAGTSLELLQHAMKRSRLASAALLAMSDLARSQDAARRVLFDNLRHPQHGASAAAALGRLQDASIASDVGRALDTAPDERLRRNLALALRLDGSPAARQELERFTKSGKGSRELRKEVSAWLAR